MKISIISDTHGFIDDQIIKHLKSSEEIWHAGDIGSLQVLNQLKELPAHLRIVYGNIDDLALRSLTDEYLVFDVQGVKILIIHIADKPPRYNNEVKTLIDQHKPDILVTGHSHILRLINDKANNLLFINPGACGHQGFHKLRTLVRFEINNGKPENLEAIELGKRGQLRT